MPQPSLFTRHTGNSEFCAFEREPDSAKDVLSEVTPEVGVSIEIRVSIDYQNNQADARAFGTVWVRPGTNCGHAVGKNWPSVGT